MFCREKHILKGFRLIDRVSVTQNKIEKGLNWCFSECNKSQLTSHHGRTHVLQTFKLAQNLSSTKKRKRILNLFSLQTCAPTTERNNFQTLPICQTRWAISLTTIQAFSLCCAHCSHYAPTKTAPLNLSLLYNRHLNQSSLIIEFRYNFQKIRKLICLLHCTHAKHSSAVVSCAKGEGCIWEEKRRLIWTMFFFGIFFTFLFPSFWPPQRAF